MKRIIAVTIQPPCRSIIKLGKSYHSTVYFIDRKFNAYLESAHTLAIPFAKTCKIIASPFLNHQTIEVEWRTNAGEEIASLEYSIENNGESVEIDSIEVSEPYRKHKLGISSMTLILNALQKALKHHYPKKKEIQFFASSLSVGPKWGSVAWARYGNFRTTDCLDKIKTQHNLHLFDDVREKTAYLFSDNAEHIFWLSGHQSDSDSWMTAQHVKQAQLYYRGEHVLLPMETREKETIQVTYGIYLLLHCVWQGSIPL